MPREALALGLAVLITQFILPVMLGTIAAAVAAAAPRDARNRFFAVFLLLVAGNYAFNAFDWLDAYRYGPGRSTIAWLRGSYVFFALDPFFLLYFASVFPQRSRLNRWRVIAPFGIASVTLAFLAMRAEAGVPAVWNMTMPFTDGAVSMRWPLIAFMYACYGTAFVSMHRVHALAVDARARSQARSLFLALAAILVPRVALLHHDLGVSTALVLAASWLTPLITLGLGVLGLALAYAAVRVPWGGVPAPATGARLWRHAGIAAGSVIAVILALDVLDIFMRGGGGTLGETARAIATAPGPVQAFVSFARYAVRWIAFSVLVSYALLRYRSFDLDVRLKQAFVAGQVLTLLAIASALTLNALHDAPGVSHVLVPLPLVITLLVAGAGVWPSLLVARRVAERVLPHLSGNTGVVRHRRLETYRARVDAILEDGAWDDPRLARLRARYGITDAEHARVVARRGASLRAGTRELLAGRYRVLEALGSGGEGHVVLARDVRSGDLVAVKTVRDASVDARTLGNLVREARVMQDVEHPGVVRVLDVIEHASRVLIVMEYAPAGSVSDLVRARGALPPRDALLLVTRVLDALAAAHARGVVHRDVKPSNVLLAADGSPRLADFGVAHAADADATWSGTPPASSGSGAGTRAYMAPEQAHGGRVTPAADVYAAAVLLLDLVTGEFAVAGRAPRERARDPRVPAAWHPVLARALDARPHARWADAAAFRDALVRAGVPEPAPRVIKP